MRSKIAEKILSETSEKDKKRVREYANNIISKSKMDKGKFYITKYWATKGIISIKKSSNIAKIWGDKTLYIEDINSIVPNTTIENFPKFHHKPYWHENLQDAIKHCEILRKKKISSLELNILKLKNIDFNKNNDKFKIEVYFGKNRHFPVYGDEAYSTEFHSFYIPYGREHYFKTSKSAIEYINSIINKKVISSGKFDTISYTVWKGNIGSCHYIKESHKKGDTLPIDKKYVEDIFKNINKFI